MALAGDKRREGFGKDGQNKKGKERVADRHGVWAQKASGGSAPID